MSISTAIATIDQFNLPTQANMELFDPEEFDGIAPEFPRVKIPSGGALSFEIPNPDDPDDPIPSKTLEGVIVYQHKTNGYWETSEGLGSPPDCASADGAIGRGNPGGSCEACPLNQFGSGEGGEGKACKNMQNVYLLRDGDVFPILLVLPPTSIKAFRQYANTLRYANRALSGVITSVSLKKQESGGNTYSVASFKMVGVLASDLAQQARRYAAVMREGTRSMSVDAPDTKSAAPHTDLY